MMIYYKMAFDIDENFTLLKLGKYYFDIKNYDKMLICFEKAIHNGYIPAMNALAGYYRIINNHEEMIKYYLMAINKEYVKSMFHLGHYYDEFKDYENMKKY